MKKKLDKKYWQKICASPKEAKKALIGLTMPNGARVTEVQLKNGNTIPVSQVTEHQAHEFMLALCPDWAKDS